MHALKRSTQQREFRVSLLEGMTSYNGKRDKVIQWRDVLEQNVHVVFHVYLSFFIV